MHKFQVCFLPLDMSSAVNAEIEGLAFPGEGRYWSFSFMSRHMIENLPEPLRSGVTTSHLWQKEGESGGLAVSNCLSLYLPETNNEDALFVARVGYDNAFTISNLLGFGDAVFEAGKSATEDTVS